MMAQRIKGCCLFGLMPAHLHGHQLHEPLHISPCCNPLQACILACSHLAATYRRRESLHVSTFLQPTTGMPFSWRMCPTCNSGQRRRLSTGSSCALSRGLHAAPSLCTRCGPSVCSLMWRGCLRVKAHVERVPCRLIHPCVQGLVCACVQGEVYALCEGSGLCVRAGCVCACVQGWSVRV